jgi:hypothetical protein
MSVIPRPIHLWRSAKQSETLARFPFLQESRWQRWFGRTYPRVGADPALRIHHALTPFRQMGEVDGASEVIAAAARRDPGIGPTAIERLLVDLRYCPEDERRRAYRDPELWLEARARRAPRPAPRPLGVVKVS